MPRRSFDMCGARPVGEFSGSAFAIITQAVTQLTALGVVRSGASDDKFSASARRKMVREELYTDLQTISRTARVMALDSENFIDKFQIPRNNRNDMTMLETARASSKNTAHPRKNAAHSRFTPRILKKTPRNVKNHRAFRFPRRAA